MSLRIVTCKHCGNQLAFLKDAGVRPVCCGEAMGNLVANTTDAAKEKHVPVIRVEGQRVTVEIGSVAHPMTPEHSIEWVVLQTQQGNQRKCLKPGEAPSVTFALTEGDAPVAAYAFCNLHGLWKAEV